MCSKRRVGCAIESGHEEARSGGALYFSGSPRWREGNKEKIKFARIKELKMVRRANRGSPETTGDILQWAERGLVRESGVWPHRRSLLLWKRATIKIQSKRNSVVPIGHNLRSCLVNLNSILLAQLTACSLPIAMPLLCSYKSSCTFFLPVGGIRPIGRCMRCNKQSFQLLV